MIVKALNGTMVRVYYDGKPLKKEVHSAIEYKHEGAFVTVEILFDKTDKDFRWLIDHAYGIQSHIYKRERDLRILDGDEVLFYGEATINNVYIPFKHDDAVKVFIEFKFIYPVLPMACLKLNPEL